MEGLLIFALAIGFDLLLGEPPAFAHPVVWLGKAIALFEKLSPASGSQRQFLYGLFCVIVLTTTATLGIFVLLLVAGSLGLAFYILLSAALLKSTFSIRMLFGAATEVANPLKKNDLSVARYNLRSLVSRDTSQLTEPLIAAAVIESVAENSADSFVAPVFYFALFGVPGAVAYRTINTFDSMWGYHGRYEYLGKAAARIDDLVNFIPARVAGLLLVLVAMMSGRGKQTWKTMIRDHAATESPNAGWTMSAMAGALGIRLEKVGHYRLGDAIKPVGVDEIGEAIRLTTAVVVLASILFVGLALVIPRFLALFPNT